MGKGSNAKVRFTGILAGVSFGAVALFGGIARADSFHERVRAEMGRGKDYVQAIEIASRAEPRQFSDGALARARVARAALSRGKDYSDAWAAASRQTERSFSDDQIARAEGARRGLAMGKDYVDAIAASATELAPAPELRIAKRERAIGIKTE